MRMLSLAVVHVVWFKKGGDDGTVLRPGNPQIIAVL